MSNTNNSEQNLNAALAKLYPEHIRYLQKISKRVLLEERLDALVIHSGQPLRRFLDDIDYPFVANPQFKAWLPLLDNPHCWLLVDGENKPKLLFHQSQDFWHQAAEIPSEFWSEQFDVVIFNSPVDVGQYLPYDKANTAYLGECVDVAKALSFGHINPDAVVHYLHYHRAYKTEYEKACMREANRLAVIGHEAAEQAFAAGESEFGVHQAYLNACSLGENELPYPNIIALNDHASVLHYQKLNRTLPTKVNSLLIDAGVSCNGYAADITRTYMKGDGEFAELIKAIDKLSQTMVAGLKPNSSYVDLHLSAHQHIAEILSQFNIVKTPVEQTLESGLTSTFFPHGLGHHLGLQVHDVGGLMADSRGTHISVPEQHPFLRVTRQVEANMVFTIEPGLYFIDSLLKKLNDSELAGLVNWDKINEFRPYGGVRIEDNVIVHVTHNENMTRDAFARS